MFSLFTHVGSSALTFFGGLKPNTLALYTTDIAHHHLGVGVLFVLSSHLHCVLYKALGNKSIGKTGLKTSFTLHKDLSLGCTVLAILTSVIAQQASQASPYVYLCYDYVTRIAIYVHHQYIGSALMMASMLHAALYTITDNSLAAATIYKLKGQLLSHLSWVCLYVGFHTLGIYIHNDTVLAFGHNEAQIIIEPVFVNASIPLGPGDVMVHHVMAQ
jgi:photosystem I P700 chlorophyll a apoprotein A2